MRAMVAAVVLVTCATAGVVSARQFPAHRRLEVDHRRGRRIVSALDPPEGSWLFGTMAPGWH